jgi:hypothetical protein
MAAVLIQEKTQPAIPKLAQDLIAGTVGGWAQVVVGKCQFIFDIQVQLIIKICFYNRSPRRHY